MSPEPHKPAEVGETFHFLVAGMTYARSLRIGDSSVSCRGEQVTITEGLLAASRDRNGSSWLDLLHEPDAQVRRWGKLAFAPGPFPTGVPATEPGTLRHEQARAEARRVAMAIPDAAERAAALERIGEVYGGAPPTSQTLAAYGRER